MWRVEYDPTEQRLALAMRETVFGRDMRDLARAHARALEATGGQPFKVLVDLRGLHPLDAEAARLFDDMKRVASRVPGYRGRAVLVDSPTIAIQQRNATLEGGGDPSELITLDETAARAFLDG
ncbi:MAG: hypothetical protein KF729_37410 [Sandaracinaceae bacterium]|nr:hypothetical protein [Sandaracinaceae bacterium]